MTIVLNGVYSREMAESLSERASNSHRFGYPAASTFEASDNPENWHVNIYLQDEYWPAQEALDESSTNLLIQELGEDARTLKAARLDDAVDWVSEGLKELQPVVVERFFIHGAHDAAKVRPFHHAIQIDANLAFGTGHHGTTAGCLEAIALVTRRHKFNNILDLGTGSGILAAALAKQTRQPVLATDIDPVSTRVARENMQLNKVAALVHCETAGGFQHPIFAQKGRFGLVVANILAGPLRALAKPMCKHLADNATIILSGLLIRQQAAVLSAYREQGAFLIKAIHREGWATLILNRP